MTIIPVNRYILIEPFEEELEKKEEQSFVLYTPDTIEKKIPYAIYKVLNYSNISLDITINDKIVVENHMVEKIKIGDNVFYLILENYVKAILKEKESDENKVFKF